MACPMGMPEEAISGMSTRIREAMAMVTAGIRDRQAIGARVEPGFLAAAILWDEVLNKLE